MSRSRLLALVAALYLFGCAQAPIPTPTSNPTPSPRPTSTAVPTSTPRPTPTVTVAPSPRLFPTESEVELEAERYAGSPPFDIPFTFAIPGPGWYSAHLHGEFLDVMRLDGPDPHVPTRWLAWAHPTTVYGAEPVEAADLSPDEAAAAVATNGEIDATAPSAFTFAGLDGAQVDVHTNSSNVPVFGGPDGDFGLQPSHDARLGFVTITGELVIVMCLGEPAELDAACADVQPILDSVEL